MKLRSNAILCVILVAVLCLSAPFAIRILLRTEAAQKRIAATISAATGLQVSYEAFEPSLWSESRITRLNASNHNGASVSVKEAFVTIDLRHLFQKQFFVRSIRLEGAHIAYVEPSNASSSHPPTATGNGPSEVAENPPAVDGKVPLGERISQLSALRSLRITDSSIDWHLADGRSKLRVDGLDLQLAASPETGSEKGPGSTPNGTLQAAGSDTTTSGTGHASRITCADAFLATNLRARITIANNEVRFGDIQAACGEGSVLGEGKIGMLAPQPFSLRVDATNVDLEKMSAELPSLRMAGSAQGNVMLEGSLFEDATWRGNAKLQVEEGRFKGVSVLQMLGQVFQIQELSNFKIRRGAASLRIADKNLVLDELQLDGNDIVLSAPGNIDFQRNLTLNAKLTVPEKLLNGKVMQLLSGGFSAPDEAGLRCITFQVGGTLDRPSTNLMEKAVGGGLGGVVNQLLGNFLKGRKVEKPAPKEAAPVEAQ